MMKILFFVAILFPWSTSASVLHDATRTLLESQGTDASHPLTLRLAAGQVEEFQGFVWMNQSGSICVLKSFRRSSLVTVICFNNAEGQTVDLKEYSREKPMVIWPSR